MQGRFSAAFLKQDDVFLFFLAATKNFCSWWQLFFERLCKVCLFICCLFLDPDTADYKAVPACRQKKPARQFRPPANST